MDIAHLTSPIRIADTVTTAAVVTRVVTDISQIVPVGLFTTRNKVRATRWLTKYGQPIAAPSGCQILPSKSRRHPAIEIPIEIDAVAKANIKT